MNRPTLKTGSTPLNAATAIGLLTGIILLMVFNIVVATAIAAFALNVVGGFGFSFWQTAGIGILLAQAAPTFTSS